MNRHFQGMLQIVRFNPWFYLAGTLLLIIAALILAFGWMAWPWPLRWLALGALSLALWWLLASLVVSHLVYDWSDWSHGGWLLKMIDQQLSERVLNVHCGFDETTMRLRRWLPDSDVVALDLYDANRLTERSIHRARSFLPPLPGTLKGTPESWPDLGAAFDMVCFLLSAHEYRCSEEREALFHRARESLHSGGRVILAEHVRDTANFLAFGPGFLHFHTPASWQQAWQRAGFQVRDHQRVTPWLRVWQLQLSNS